MNKLHIIFSGDREFRVLRTVRTTHEEAWEIANRLAQHPNKDFDHYDVLGGYDTEQEMDEDIRQHYAQSKLGYR
jgi:hypothetical protein